MSKAKEYLENAHRPLDSSVYSTEAEEALEIQKEEIKEEFDKWMMDADLTYDDFIQKIKDL